MREQQKQKELEFWSTYGSHLCETDKQNFYAKKMGLQLSGYFLDLQGKSILEIGAGPNALALRAGNGRRKVVEPLQYPQWVWERYDYFGVEYDRCPAEEMCEYDWDEVWVANVLQHVDELDIVLQNIRNSAKVLRIFEFLNIPTDEFHNYTLQKEYLDQMLGIDGSVEYVDRPYMYNADAYFGVYDLQAGNVRVGNGQNCNDMNVHFVNTGPDFPYTYYIGVMTALKVYGDKVILWFTEEPTSNYWELLKDKVNMRRIDDIPEFPVLRMDDCVFKFQAIFDYCIWNIIYECGGMIMGLDSLTLAPHFDLLEDDKELLVPITNGKVHPPWLAMHGAVVRKGSTIAAAVVEDGLQVLGVPGSSDAWAMKWGSAGMGPFIKRVSENPYKVSLAPFGMCAGRVDQYGKDFYLFQPDGQLLHQDTRTIPLYASSTEFDIRSIAESFVRDTDTLYSRLVKQILTEKEWNPEVQAGGESSLNRHWGGDLHRAMIHYIKAKRDSQPLVGIEVGVLAGMGTEIILNVLNIEKLYLVDPYMVYDTDVYSQANLDEAKRLAMKRLEPFGDKVEWLPLTSKDAAEYFSRTGQLFDFVYLDGDHAYDGVTSDVADYYPLVKDDGVLGGHDFIDDIVDLKNHRFIQVKSAVQDWCGECNISFYSCDFAYSDWWIDKSEI